MNMIRQSRYTFLIHKDDNHLIYNAVHNMFLRVDEATFTIIKNIQHLDNTANKETIKKLRELGIITTEDEDNNYVENLKLKYLTHSFSKENLGITLVPTIACNLVCPYCFEENKPKGMMGEETCESVLKFIEDHSFARNLFLTWFGGEPMLGSKIMSYFLHNIEKLKEIKLVRHSIVTNGTLLNKERCKIFHDVPLDSIQITLDGTRNTHNKKRIYPDGTGTYDKIINNLLYFAEDFPKTGIAIRVNIDKNNAHEFKEVKDEIQSLLPNKKNLFVYPGILKACGKKKTDSPFLLNNDIKRINEEAAKEGESIDYPEFSFFGCGATNISSYVIGPRGELYKCWQDVGKREKEIGSIFNSNYSNLNLLNKYMLHGSHILDPNCAKCPVLPICDKDCAYDRIENIFEGGDKELCSLYKEEEYLKDRLYLYYKSHIERN